MFNFPLGMAPCREPPARSIRGQHDPVVTHNQTSLEKSQAPNETASNHLLSHGNTATA